MSEQAGSTMQTIPHATAAQERVQHGNMPAAPLQLLVLLLA
jgi:hypothetical protein